MRTLVVQETHAQRLLSHLWFCQAQPFAKHNPARLKLGSNCSQFGHDLTRDWNQRVKKQFKDGHMNCLMSDNGVIVTVPNTEDKGNTYLRVEFGKGDVTVLYPRHDATSMLRTMISLLWLQDVGPLVVDGQQMNVMQATAIGSMCLALGESEGRRGAGILYDMLQDGEFGSNRWVTPEQREKETAESLEEAAQQVMRETEREMRNQRLEFIDRARAEGLISQEEADRQRATHGGE